MYEPRAGDVAVYSVVKYLNTKIFKYYLNTHSSI